MKDKFILMKRVGVAELPLHGGRCPPWLFSHMKRLGGAISEIIVQEYGRQELLRRLADPFFFQALGCVLGYDWHSSGLTTVTMGALKEAIEPEELGISVCGGKGRASKRTPSEIQKLADVFSISSKKVEDLKYASRMAAKVDNACVQDGYQLYHHAFVLSEDGDWAVIQQGMHDRLARRYHWLSEGIRSFVEEPHSGIIGDRREEVVLDMTARESEETRKASVDLVRDNPKRLLPYVREAEQRSLDEYFKRSPQVLKLVMPTSHAITKLTKQTVAALQRAYELQPKDYEELVAIRGLGPKAVRALALVSDLIYGKPPSWRDPAKFSFAHGGKDAIPYPVDRKTYQKTIEILEGTIQAIKVGQKEKLSAVRRLHEFLG
ncbi:MAG: DUF763 domain-containing protein [Candidatus Hodarchaeaceae archaeon]|nr:DUF763 domain-containing protein [Candidatus Hodarchaeaceae archaeon]